MFLKRFLKKIMFQKNFSQENKRFIYIFLNNFYNIIPNIHKIYRNIN